MFEGSKNFEVSGIPQFPDLPSSKIFEDSTMFKGSKNFEFWNSTVYRSSESSKIFKDSTMFEGSKNFLSSRIPQLPDGP